MADGIKLIVGLGNPTARYDRTRHNAGFWFLDRVAQQLNVTLRDEPRFLGLVGRPEWRGKSLFLLKPSTYMNRSGHAVVTVASYYKITPSEVLVAHDDLDLMPGAVRLKKGGGHGGHNGLRDMVAHLGSADFYRLRFGIGHPGDRSRVVDYVLDSPPKDDAIAIDGALSRVLAELEALLDGDFSAVMNRLNAVDCGSENKA